MPICATLSLPLYAAAALHEHECDGKEIDGEERGGGYGDGEENGWW
jgi:hypothetical protein